MSGIRSESTTDNGDLLFFVDFAKVPNWPRSMSHKDQEVKDMPTRLNESSFIFNWQQESRLVTMREPSRLTAARDVKEIRRKVLVLGIIW